MKLFDISKCNLLFWNYEIMRVLESVGKPQILHCIYEVIYITNDIQKEKKVLFDMSDTGILNSWGVFKK